MAEHLTPDQENCLTELRQILKDEIPNEMFQNTLLLTKFLIARDFNTKQAVSMIKKNLLWKKEMQIDTILLDFKPPEVLAKYATATFIGYDKEGCVVRYLPLGKMDNNGICKSTNIIYFLKYILQVCQEDIKMHESQSIKLGRPISQTVNIYDVSNLSLAHITHKKSVQMFLKFLMIFQDNYPETVKRNYVINASAYFTFLWPAIRKCLGTSLMKKIFIYAQDGWKEELLKVIDADVLPAFLGGNRLDPDGNPMCLTTVNHFGQVPAKYFLEKNIDKFARKPGVKSVTIDRQGRYSVPIQIAESKYIINWEFETECRDIGFGILLEEKDGSVEELVPTHKIETELEPHIGMYRCKKPGKHVILFDNSYSWFHAKEVYYRTWLTDTQKIDNNYHPMSHNYTS